MKKLTKQEQSLQKEDSLNHISRLNDFFINSLQEMYFAENAISVAFINIKDQISTTTLNEILHTHFDIHLKHKERLEKIFQLKKERIDSKNCTAINALLSEGKDHLSLFDDDKPNWEIALILLSQKLAHYKIATYGGLAHLAINLKYHQAATFLAFSVQEEEEFIANNLNGIIDTFLTSHIEGYKK